MSDNNDNIVRVSCVNENCGTFPMDEALHRKLQRTGEAFTCSAGHKQHFTESPLQKKNERIKELKTKLSRLEDRVEKYRDQALDRHDDVRDEKRRGDHLEKMLLSRVAGIVEVSDGEFKWSCSCGSHGRDGYEDPDEARKRFKAHQRRNDCQEAPTENVVEA